MLLGPAERDAEAQATTEERLAIINGVLPDGVEAVDGPMPPAPVDFAANFTLPAHYEKPVNALTNGPEAARLKFFEEPHVYTYDGLPLGTSVTSIAHLHGSTFDPDGAVRAMKRGTKQRWPCYPYVADAKLMDDGSWSTDLGVLAVRDNLTIEVLPPKSLREGRTAEEARTLMLPSAEDRTECTFYTFTRVLTDQEIKQGWKDNAELARNQGTHTHLQCELFFNGLPYRHCEPEMAYLNAFVKRFMLPLGLKIYATEKEIVLPDADFAGSIDLLAVDPSGVVHVLDFKRTKKLQNELHSTYRNMKAPFTHLQDSKGAGYALQLSLYQVVLERNYGLRIGSRVLLALHEENSFATSVPLLRREAEFLIDARVRLTAARRAVADREPDCRCALSGVPLVDAVRVDKDGASVLACPKAAMLHGMTEAETEQAADEAFRARFDALVAEVHEPLKFPRATEEERWTARMPAGGIVPFADAELTDSSKKARV